MIIVITGESRILRMLFTGNIMLKNRTAKSKTFPNFSVFKLTLIIIILNNSYKNSLNVMKTIYTLHKLNIETFARQHNSF